jgi:hypothetical protein
MQVVSEHAQVVSSDTTTLDLRYVRTHGDGSSVKEQAHQEPTDKTSELDAAVMSAINVRYMSSKVDSVKSTIQQDITAPSRTSYDRDYKISQEEEEWYRQKYNMPEPPIDKADDVSSNPEHSKKDRYRP